MSTGARSRKPLVAKVSETRIYEVLRAPMITEKSTTGAQYNQVTFKVALDASKPEIKAAVEKLFSVKVEKVNTLRQKGKVKRFRGRRGQRNDFKKAIVTLSEGDSIDVTTGI